MTTPEEWLSLGDYFLFREHKIFYREQINSDKPTLLLLHGFPTASWDWEAMWPLLTNHFNLIAVDFLGFGFSAKPHPHNYSIDEQVDLLIAFLKMKDLNELHVMAHDYAVSVAQELLARQQAGELSILINSICFLNGGMFPQAYRPRLIQKLLLSPLGPALSIFINQGSLDRNFKAIFGAGQQPDKKYLAACWRVITYNNGKRVVPYVIQYLKDRKRNAARWTEAVREAKLPLRLINGPEDPISGERLAKRYQEIAAQADVIRLPGIGHYPNVEAPALVVQHYLDFIAEQAE